MRDTPAMSRRLPRALLVGLLAAAAAGALAATGALDRVEANLVDQRFELRGSQGPPPDVAVVAIDEATFGRLDQPWPFPRSLHARAIRALLAAGAREVVYDVQFSEPSRPREDRALLAAAASPRVLLGTTEVADDGTPAVIGARVLRSGGGRVGVALFPVADDGVWRDVRGTIERLPQLSVLAAGGRLATPQRPIDFAGPPGTVRTLSFADVVQGRLDPRAVRGRIVVVGATAPAQQDLHPTAAGGGLMAGAEIHANAIQTVLDGYPLRDAPGLVVVLLVLAAGLLAPLAALPGPPGRALAQALGAGLLGALALLGGAQLAFDGGTILPLATPLLALALGTTGAVATTYALELRARRQLRATLERFVPPQVADELLPRSGGQPRQLASRRVEATVLFCDLRGFTTLAEGLEAEQVIAVLNRYLEAVSGAIFTHDGTVVSYQGDGVMAVFGAPLAQADHAARALAAAREILGEALPRFGAWLREEGIAAAPLAAGIGLATGTVMAGLVGSGRRLEYTAVGDTTNVAARLQALGRDAPGQLFVSATTYAQLGPAAEGLALHGEVELRGRREPVTVYALSGAQTT
jgi:adenylate cyclase